MTAAIRILYVDDEPDLLGIGKLFLERSGDFTVTTAPGAPEGIRLLEQEQFDAIVSDYQMPGMDGIQFLVEVRSRFGPIPFILFTGRGREEVVIQAINSGADFYLQKGGEPGAQFAELSHKIKSAALRKRADDSLRMSEDRYHQYIDNAPDGIFIADETGRYLEVNPAACRITGYEKEELLSMHIPDLLAPESLEAGAMNFKEVIESGHACSELLFRHKDDTLRHWLVDAVRLSPTRFLGFVKDITERKLAEDVLAESEEKYRNLYESSADGIASVNMDGHIIDANNAFCAMTGYTLQELEQLSYNDLTQERWHNMEERILREQVVIRGFSDIYEKEYIRKDGSIMPIALRTWLLRDYHGEPRGMWAIVRDITERKQQELALLKNTEELHASYEEITATEEELRANLDEMTRQDLALKKSEEQLHLAIESANLGLWDMNLLNGEMIHNQRWAEMLGFSMDELEKPSEWWGQRVHPDDYQHVLKLSESHRAGKTPFFDAVYRMKHKNGAWRWVHSQGKIILRDSNGAALRLIGVNQDITGQKLAEQDILRKNEELEASYEELTATGEELQQTINYLTQSEQKLSESEEKYRTVFENTGTATVVVDENNIISLANTQFAQLSGFSKDDIEGKKSWTEFVVKEDLERMLTQHRLRRQNREEALTHYEFRFITKSEDIRNIYLSIDIIPGTKKSVASLLDITGRKKAEELYQTIFENTGTAMIILEEDTTISRVNEEMEKIWGYSKEEIEGRVKWPTLVAAEDLQKMLEYHRLRRTDHDSAPRNYEFRFVHKNGKLLDASLTASMIPGTKKSVVSLRDITELKKIERALRESGERLNFALESAHLGLWDLNFVTYEVIHNRQWTEMLGFSSAEMNKPSSWWQERVHPDDSDFVSKRNEDHVAGRAPYFDCIYRMKHENGSWRWLHSRGKVVSRDIEGQPLRMIGINQDITERKVAEEALRESEEQLHNFISNLPVGLYRNTSGPLGKYTMANPYIARMHGYDTLEEFLCQSTADMYVNPDERIVFSDQLIREGRIIGREILLKRKNKEIFWGQVSAIAVRNQQGEVKYFDGFIEDITERKVAEEALLKNAEELHASNEELTATDEELRQTIDELGRTELALRENEDKFRVLSEQSSLGLGIIQDGIFQYFNSGYCAISGYSEDEIRRWQPYEYAKTVHPADLDFVMEQIQKKQMNSSDAVMHYSFRALNKEGAVMLLELYSRTVMYHGRPADFVTFIDITGRKVAEEALQQANKKLTLLSSLTRHDINNQLTVLQGYLDILEQKQPDTTLTEYFQKINIAAQRISSMIQFTKEYEKIGVHAPVWQDCRVLVDTTAKEATLGKVVVKNDLPAGTEVFADPLVVKVCYNLMDNAARYGGKITTIRFSVEEHDGDRVVICEDDGDGVVAEEKEKIFERGFGKNTGLGLALSREILSITDIIIRETGEPGKGARFEMTVPKGAWRITNVQQKKE